MKTLKQFIRESVGDTAQMGMFPGAEDSYSEDQDYHGSLIQDEHSDEAEDAALVRKMVKPDCLEDHEIEIDYDDDEDADHIVETAGRRTTRK